MVSELTLVRHLCRRGRRRLQLPEAPLQHPVLLNCVYLLAAWLCSLQATDTIGDIGKRTCSRCARVGGGIGKSDQQGLGDGRKSDQIGVIGKVIGDG